MTESPKPPWKTERHKDISDVTTLLRLATAGSVDDGKSTLVGRLLHDTKSILADQFDSVERISRERGLASADLALLTDGLRSEREQGITIDVAYRYFATDRRTFILADCPGHEQYTRNTVTGSSTADVLIVLVDVRKGVQDQTRRHLAVAGLLRVPHVIVAINKMDLIDHDVRRYAEVATDIIRVAETFGVPTISPIPVSALNGDNIVHRSPTMHWYTGPSLVELLEELPTGPSHHENDLRFPVQLVVRPQSAAAPEHHEYRGYAGQINEGRVHVGDEVLVLPAGLSTRVVGIDAGSVSLETAQAPRSVTLRLADEIDISRGDVIVASHEPPALQRELRATLAWLDGTPLVAGARVLLKHGTSTVQAIVTEVSGRLGLETGDLEPAEVLTLNDIGDVHLRLATPLPIEDYVSSRTSGAFLLIDAQQGTTLAAGMAGTRTPVLAR